MSEKEQFIKIAAVICEPVRARMLWSLLDGRAYTAGELALFGEISSTSASNHLTKLLEAHIVKVEIQGRHRYYSFSNTEVAYAVESLAMLASPDLPDHSAKSQAMKPIEFCRTCYDHLAGFVGVQITEALELKGCLEKYGTTYLISNAGWKLFTELDISKLDFEGSRRPLTRQCLDWSQRRPHLAGQLGSVILEKMLKKGWFRKVDFSRELILTSEGRQQLFNLLELNIPNNYQS